MSDKTFRPSFRNTIVDVFVVVFGLLAIGLRTSVLFISLSISFSIILVVIILVIIFDYFNWKNTFYDLEDDGLLIRSGIIAKSKKMMLYKEIQDVSENQGLLQMILGLTNLNISTMAGASLLKGLHPNDAEQIKSQILDRVGTTKKAKTTKSQTSSTLAMNEVGMPYPIHPFRSALITFIPSLLVLSVVGLVIFVLISISFVGSGDKLSIFAAFLVAAFIALGGAVMLGIVVFVSAAITSSAFFYSISGDGVLIRYSFMSKVEKSIPLEKIQDLLLFESFFNRFAKLVDLTVETGEKSMIVNSKYQKEIKSIGPLNLTDAKTLQGQILESLDLDSDAKSLKENFPLSSKKPVKESVKSIVFFSFMIIALAVIASVISSNNPLVFPAAAILIFLFSVLKLIYEYNFFSSYFYSDNKDILVLSKGVFNRATITIPYGKVEQIFLDQDLFDRFFGLWDVHIGTAGTSGMEIHVDGVESEIAGSLRNLLIKRTT